MGRKHWYDEEDDEDDDAWLEQIPKAELEDDEDVLDDDFDEEE